MSQKIIGATVGTPLSPDKIAEKLAPLLVTVTENEDGTYTADKTYDELVAAQNAGKTLLCYYYDDDVYLPLTAYYGTFVFSTIVDSCIYQIEIHWGGENQEARVVRTKTDLVGPPADGGGGSNASHFTMTLKEDLLIVNLPMPVNWEKILQFNVHMTTDFASEMSWSLEAGGSTNNQGALSAGLKGLNIYGTRYLWETGQYNYTTFSLGINSVTNSSKEAMPIIGTKKTSPTVGKNNLTLKSLSGGVTFPKGTRFDVWAVYAL